MKKIITTITILIIQCITLYSQNAGMLIQGEHGMVVSASDEASRVGLEILMRGGNAIDAAVAVGFALAVTYPSAGNLGGGLYMVLHTADGKSTVIDSRETAPRAATGDMYLDNDGQVIKDKSLHGPVASGVPGSVDGLLTALDKFGTMPKERVILPALVLARDGFVLRPHMERFFRRLKSRFKPYPSSLKVFYKGNRYYRAGELWIQSDLAETLQRIAMSGREGFYSGKTADLIVGTMRKYGGIITHEDLRGYRSVVREPVRFSYRGHEVLSVPPSSSGGIVLAQIMRMLEPYNLSKSGLASSRTVHLMVESMKRAFADRSRYLGDPDYVDIPQDILTSAGYIDRRRADILPDRATPSTTIQPGDMQFHGGDNTTHYSIVDYQGNAVSVTTTLNSVCGNKCVVEGAGFLLNNEMDDFSVKSGTPNQFGLTGGFANSIAPGKRMLSSMTPTIVLKNDQPYLILGSPGGSKIITAVLQVISNVIDHNLPIDRAINRKRIHHQWLPDTVFFEPAALSPEVAAELSNMGHILKPGSAHGKVDGILCDMKRKTYYGCSDPRGHGSALGY